VKRVDHLGSGDAGEEVLVAAGEADRLVRKHRPENEARVRLGDQPVHPYPDGLGEQPRGGRGDLGGRDLTQVRECLRVVPGVVVHRHTGVAGGPATRRQVEAVLDGLRWHRRVRAERDQHVERRHPAGQRVVHLREEAAEWDRPGAVRHEHHDAGAVQVEAVQLVAQVAHSYASPSCSPA
jgi:hypothetical protein